MVMPPLSSTSTFPLLRGGERERERKACSTGHGQILSSFWGVCPGDKPSLGQADCQIVPRAKQPEWFEEPAQEFTAPECGPGERMQLSLAPFIGQKMEAQRGEATGPRSHSGLITEWGIMSSWSRLWSLRLAHAVLAEVHVDMDSLYSHCRAANQAQRMRLSPCSTDFPLGNQPQSQGPGTPQLEGARRDPLGMSFLALWPFL